MADFIDFLYQFGQGVNNPVFMLEERRQVPAGDITILINSGTQNRTAVSPVPDGIVGAAAEKRNPKGSPDNQHPLSSSILSLDMTQINI